MGIMKRMKIFLAAALMLACSNEKEPGTSTTNPEFEKFTASFVEKVSETKTILNDDMTVGWVEGDEVMVYNGVAAHRFVASLAGSSNSTAELSPINEGLTLKKGNTYYALYPYDESARWSGTSVTFTFPSLQNPVPGTFSYNPSVAYTTGSDMAFRNVCALVEFSVSSDNVSKIVFEGCSNEDIAGKIRVDCKSYPPIAEVVNGVKSVTVEGSFVPDVKYYVALLPNDFKKGIRTTSYDKTGNTYVKESEPFDLSRSSRIEMGVINEFVPFVPDGHPVLFFDYQQGEELKAKLETTHAEVWQRVKVKADTYMKRTPTEFKDDEGEQLWQREVGNTIQSLAFAGYMSEDQKYFDKAYAWAEKSASYPTWGTDNTSDGQEFGLAYGHQLLGLAMLYDYGQGYLTRSQLERVRETLVTRARRLYTAYTAQSLNLLTNHCWINICGILASAMALHKDYEETSLWKEFALTTLGKVSRLLIKDGVSQEGPGYWQYGMEFLMIDFDLAKSLGSDFYANSPLFWQNTAKFGRHFILPLSFASKTESLIDWGDAKRVCWYGPVHIFHKLAAMNNDGISQAWAEEAVKYDVSSSWLDVLWYDPSVNASIPSDMPESHHFEETGFYTSRTGWNGAETVVIYRCGAPLGKSANPSSGYSQGDLGHVHPDAGHFVIYDDGEYIVRNTGYVKRQSKYHNVALIGENGLWGDKSGYFSPWPLTPARYPSITSISAEEGVETIVSDMSASYQDAAAVKTYTRKFIWFKTKDVVVIVDDIECTKSMDIKVQIYPESQTGTCLGNVYTDRTDIHNIRIESLSSGTSMGKYSQTIESRSKDNPNEEMALLKVSLAAQKCRIVTAISWSKAAGNPVKVFYDEQSGKITVDEKELDLTLSHEGFGNKSQFEWE